MWICITKHRKEMEKPPDFAMLLRKYIGRGKILKIEQYDFDRIVIFEIEKKGVYRLIVELIPNGNVILVDEKGKIVNSLIKQQWKHRTIKPGEEYSFPPSRENPFEMKYEEFRENFKEKDVVRSIVKMGIPGKWAEEICNMAAIDKKTPSEKLGEEQIKKLYDAMLAIIKKFEKGEFKPVIVNGDVLPMPIGRYDGMEVMLFDSVNEAFDEFYFRYLIKRGAEGEGEKEKMKRQIQMQEKAIKDFREKAERFKKEGDALFSNFEKVDEMIKNKNYIEKKYPKAIIEMQYSGEKLEIEIDVTKSAIENAQEKYRMSKKMKEKAEKAEEAMKEAIKKMDKIKVEEKKVEKKREKKFWFEDFRWFISSEGNIVIGGKDAKSNEKVVKKYLGKDDIYVHADVHGAPSCVVKSVDIDGRKIGIGKETLREACHFAVIYSKAWKQFGKASAYWVYPEQVSKAAPPGEYLPRGAFMVRGKRNYIEAKMEFAIGIVEIKGEKKVMGGPPSAVKKWSSKWILFEPGEREKNEIAKEISRLFDVQVEKVLAALPSGGFRKKEEKL